MTIHYIPSVTYQDAHLQFSTHGLNCFAVVKYLASSVFSPTNPDLFYTYLYLYSHYDFLHVAANPNHLYKQPYDAEVLARYVLVEKLGLEIVEISVKENLEHCIQEQLDQMWPVIVPTDKGVFLFGEHNQLHDQLEDPYPLLVVGYDTDTHNFAIYDDINNYPPQTQRRPEKGIYAEFSVPEGKLERAFEVSNKHYQLMRDTIQILRPKNPATVKSRDDALKDIIIQVDVYKEHFSDLLTRKLISLSQRPPTSCTERERDYMIRSELRYINSQKILCDTLPKLFENDVYDEEIKEKIIKCSITAWQSWKNLLMILTLAGVNKQQNFKIPEQLQTKVLDAEEQFLSLLASLKK